MVLAPEDFGINALSAFVVSLLTVLTSFGVDMALIQRRDTDASFYDTAWTIRFLQTASVALILWLFAGTVAEYFNDERLVGVLRVLALGVLISGLENIGVVSFRKELEFNKHFWFMVSPKLVSFIATLVLALWLRNYWALILGILINRVVAVVLSYIVHPHRPWFTVASFRELWSFSQWMLLRNIGMFLRKEVDTFFVAQSMGTEKVGLYSVPKQIAQLPTTEIIWPMAGALFPGYAKIADDSVRIGLAFQRVLSTIALIALPSGVGLAIVAEPLVEVVFGERWLPTIPVLQWMSLYGSILTISSCVQAPLIAMGYIRRVSLLIWVQLLIVVPAIIYAASTGSLALVAKTQLASAIILLPVFFFAIRSTGIVKWSSFGSAIWRPALATGLMALALYMVPDRVTSDSRVELVALPVLGGFVFVVTNTVLWILSGKPDGGERAILQTLSSRLRWAAKLLNGSNSQAN